MPDRQEKPFQTMRPAPAPDALAPDGSEIRLLPVLDGGSMVHCTLPAGGVSRAVAHRTVEELWFFIAGEGEVWRRRGALEETVTVAPGIALTIPLGTHFQFRNTGSGPLEFIIVTMPPWPGDDEATPVEDHWAVD
jgi:mannose-6-phosphate isomerase-like protein (cupin superfamily)